jgi:hypothetical protein
MKTWIALVWVVGAVLLGGGCAANEPADEDGTGEASLAIAPGGCRTVCHQECTSVGGVRRCRSVCHRVCF